jgi:protein SCO1/2
MNHLKAGPCVPPANPVIAFGFAVLIALTAQAGAGETNVPVPASAAAEAGPSLRAYKVRGVVKELETDGKTVRIRHDEIPGYMPAMTMPFEARNTNELAGLKPGDWVSFRMVVSETDGWIEQVRKLDVAEKTGAPTSGPFRLVRDVEPLNVGDALPDYTFTNHLGQAVSLSQFRGQALAINFLFTRCPYPLFCPLMANNFEKAQQQLLAKSSGPTNWHLFTLSFDPDYDTPPRLKAYAERHHCDKNRWTFATGKLIDITALTEQCGLNFWHDETGGISHNLRTVVVDARGRVQRILPENKWSVEELVAEIVAAAGKP